MSDDLVTCLGVAHVEGFEDEAKQAEAYVRELEAKLAKAVAWIEDLTGAEWPLDEQAKRILAELKGEQDE